MHILLEILLIVGETIHMAAHVCGTLINLLLMFLVLTKTPPSLKTYSILILNFAISDFFACTSALIVQQRIIPGGGGLFYFSQGPCRIYGPLVCFILYSFMLHCYSHTFWSLLFSFAYRYYVLGNPTPKTRTVVLLLILVYMPSFFQFITFSFASDDVNEVKTAMAKIFDYDMSSECVSGHVSIFKWRTLYTNLYMTVPIIPMYIAILILRRLTIAKLHVDTALSDKTKHLHGQLLKALTLQACLPIFFVLAAATYAIGQLDIYHHPALQYSTFILLDGLPMLSPAISIYFIRPYHVWVRDKLCCLCKSSRRNGFAAVSAYSTT